MLVYGKFELLILKHSYTLKDKKKLIRTRKNYILPVAKRTISKITKVANIGIERPIIFVFTQINDERNVGKIIIVRTIYEKYRAIYRNL